MSLNMKSQKTIQLRELKLSNENQFVLVGGMNVLETKDMALKVAETFRKITDKLRIPYIFKASFDKANRSSIDSFRGPGLEKGLRILEKVKTEFDVPILTDIHEPQQAAPAAEVADILQLPAFLSRQTDLVVALAKTKAVINIKKAQFLAPEEMGNIIKKFEISGNDQLILCERGTSFGYNNLVVDMLGFSVMKSFGYPLLFDVTHALQRPGGSGDSAAGRRESVRELALAGLSQLEPFLRQMKEMDDLVKSFETLDTA